MIDLGTKKHPVGSVRINVHLDYEVTASIYISVHGGKWYVSFSNDKAAVFATEAELLADLQHLTEEQLMDVTIGFDRNVVTPVVSSDGTAFDYSAEQKANFQKALKCKIKWQKRFSRKQKGSCNGERLPRRSVATTLRFPIYAMIRASDQ